MGLAVTLVDKDLGYELRCADPIPFDAEYTRDLGYGAVKFLRSEAAARQGAVISFVGGRMQPLTIAWDTSKSQWFHLYPQEKHPLDDPLHWTGRYRGRWSRPGAADLATIDTGSPATTFTATES